MFSRRLLLCAGRVSKHTSLEFSNTRLSNEKARTHVRAWIDQVPVEREAKEQLSYLSSMTEVIRHPIAAMPDLHYGKGATVGTVIPMTQAIIPSAVGVDIGCGMMAVRTSIRAEHLPDNLDHARLAIECAVPHGRTHNGQKQNDLGGWRDDIPESVANLWKHKLEKDFKIICQRQPSIEYSNNINHLGTLGTGNHFVELCLDEQSRLWVMLHSGSRGVGNKIGMTYIEIAKKEMGSLLGNLPDAELAYMKEGTKHFDEYIFALNWAQDFARYNREVMMQRILAALRTVKGIDPHFEVQDEATAVNCHHNYVEHCEIRTENGNTEQVWLTRKGATSAKKGELGIIPGSMGTPSFVVKGRGNALSYSSCSHGAGRAYGRGEAKRRFTIADHEAATQGVSCRKDIDVLDETPHAYKDIHAVMAAQSDLVDIVHTLRQVVCVKG